MANAAQHDLLTWLLPSNALPYFDKELSQIRIQHFDQKPVDGHHSSTFSYWAYVVTYRAVPKLSMDVTDSDRKATTSSGWCSWPWNHHHSRGRVTQRPWEGRNGVQVRAETEIKLFRHVSTRSVHITTGWVDYSTAWNSSTNLHPPIRGRGQRRERGGRCEGRESRRKTPEEMSTKICQYKLEWDSYFFLKMPPKRSGPVAGNELWSDMWKRWQSQVGCGAIVLAFGVHFSSFNSESWVLPLALSLSSCIHQSREH